MRRLFAWLAVILLLPVLAAAAAVVAAIDGKPLVERSDAISPIAVAQVRRLLANHDPRHQQAGAVDSVDIPANLIDEGINYVAGRFLHGRGDFALTDGTGQARITVVLPGRYFLNVTAALQPVDGKPAITRASLGKLPVPAALANYLLSKAIAASGFGSEWQLALDAIQDIQVNPGSGMVTVTYQWEPQILDRARAVALSPDEIRHLHEAHQSLAALLAHRAPGSPITLAEILHATIPADTDPVGHGRAALLVLASQLARIDLAGLVPAAKTWPRVRWVMISLGGRHDLAQHFVVSATLAAWSGEPVADAIGLYKELDDARHGSGFSFIDLTADRAGTRFGELLVKKPEALMTRVRSGLQDGQLLPVFSDLPEDLHQKEFRQRFESPDSPQFKALSREIERRLDSLPLYQ
ncbi:hypothetical protein LZ012_14105 [Dechloromonas sp. XY25]|uniref:Uncharacterized protein n=1 Tax=Dechloromonas hankyongensis TaxID=2908002 RepID=A0ABS9K4W9_9RHOO|nr:hypothetical protein [Dechloromonas hankyongensis]MCG2578124.1 hypothetical protein [Dechloromonas hankyongensis]